MISYIILKRIEQITGILRSVFDKPLPILAIMGKSLKILALEATDAVNYFLMEITQIIKNLKV